MDIYYFTKIFLKNLVKPLLEISVIHKFFYSKFVERILLIDYLFRKLKLFICILQIIDLFLENSIVELLDAGLSNYSAQ
jgi:hypothetical protein